MSAVPPLSSTAVSSSSVVIDKVSEYIKTAAAEPNLDEKRKIFETAFQQIRYEPKSQALYDLLEAYARETCYSQVKGDDEEWGFKASARLLELVICLQRDAVNYPISSYDSLQKLVESLESRDFVATAVVDDALMPKSLAKVFVRLAYSYQNLEAYETNLELHKKLNTIVERLLGRDTEAEKGQLVDFMYNRCSFMARLQGLGFQAQFDSYEPVLTLIQDCYKGNEPEARSLLAQIANMRGILTYRIHNGYNALAYAKSEPYFCEAIFYRRALERELDKGDPLYLKNQRLLKNLVTTQLGLNLKRGQESQHLIKEHAEWLQRFVSEAKARGENDSYDTDDIQLLQKVNSVPKSSRLIAVMNTTVATVATAAFTTIAVGSSALLSRFMIVPAIACGIAAFVNAKLAANR